MTVKETLIICAAGKLSQIPPNTPGVPCPTCGVYFLDRSSTPVREAGDAQPFLGAPVALAHVESDTFAEHVMGSETTCY